MDLAGRGDDHPDRGRLATAGTGPRAADIADRVLAEHQVGEGLLVAVDVGGRRERAEEAHVAVVALERRLAGRGLLGDLVDHDQRVVAERGAHLDALGAALAVDGVDEDPELAAIVALARRNLAVLLRVGEVRTGGR